MYESLFSELEAQIRSANSSMRTLSSKLGKNPKNQNSMMNSHNSSISLEKKSPAFPFPKAQRFKDKDLNESQNSISSFSTNPSMDSIKTKIPGVIFAKTERFQEENEEIETLSEINPDFTVIKRKTPFLAKYHIKTTENKRKEEIIEEEPGPGEYNLQNKENKDKGLRFGKEERFKIEEFDEKTDLTPNIDVIKTRHRTIVIKPKSEENSKLREKKKFITFLDILAAKYRLNTAMELDNPMKTHVPQVFIGPDKRENNEKITRKSDLMLFFHLADKVKEFRARGPGAYNQYTRTSLENRPCMVVYRSCSPVIRRPLNLLEKKPAPNLYNPNIQLTKDSKPQYTFSKAPKEKPLKIEDLDWRKALNPDINAIRPRKPAFLIPPEAKSRNKLRALSEIQHNRIGPGRYNLIFDLVETRNDKGIVPFKLTEFNDRENFLNNANKEAFIGDLEPNYDFEKPKKPVFRYYEDIEWHAPHPADNMLFRERWRYYDYDMNKIRPEIKAIDFARNLNMREYMQFEYEYGLLEAYLARRNKIPEIGHYKPEYKQIDKKIQGFDIEKMPEREEKEYKEKEELLLNPEKIQAKILTFDIGKLLGREDKEHKEEEKLLLEPNYQQLDKKLPGLIVFDKQLDRKEKDLAPKDEELRIEPNYNQIDQKIKGNVDFTKYPFREDDPQANIKQPNEECILEPKQDLIRPHTANMVKMDKGGERFPKKSDNNQANSNEENINNPDLIKAYEAIKPEKNAIGFSGYSGREKTRIKITKKPSILFKERGKK